MLTKDEDRLAEITPFLRCPISHTASFPEALVKYEQQQLLKVAATATVTYGSGDAWRAAPLLTFQILNTTSECNRTKSQLQGYIKTVNIQEKSPELTITIFQGSHKETFFFPKLKGTR